MLSQDELQEIKVRLYNATPGPWNWGPFELGPQLEGNVKDPDMNPVLIAMGCGNDKGDLVKGCMPEKFDDSLRSCPLHPTRDDREFIAHARIDIERLLNHIEQAKGE